MAKVIKPHGIPLRLEGIRWRRGEEGAGEGRLEELTLTPGKIVLLMGANGAGKSTLLEKIAGLRPPEGLQATYGQEALWMRRRGIGRGRLRLNERALLCYSYASQSPEEGLFARSISDELDYSLRPYRLPPEVQAERRGDALGAVGWESEQWLARDPYLLSGGERRRTALAAVFAAPAPWLLLDEPTAGLDGAGHLVIARKLKELRSEGSGVVLVSHDSDWALPLADEVLLLDCAGMLRLCSREQLIQHPEWLAEAGMRVPAWLRTVHRLWLSGARLDRLGDPLAAAMAWPSENERGEAAESAAAVEVQSPVADSPSRERGIRHCLAGFDPRSIWLAYVLISVGLFTLRDWSGIAIGAAAVAALLLAGRVSLRRWRGVIANYAIFSILTSAIFASGAGGDWALRGEAFADTSFAFTRTLLILLLGLAIPLVMSPLSLRRSLERMTSFRNASPLWAQRGILAVTLMMRFVPVLLELWERFAKIIRARGKKMARNPVAFVRRLRDIALPFLLALFRLGDEVTLALESRGVGDGKAVVHTQQMKWRLRDYGLAAGGALLACGLWLLGR